MRTLKTLKSPAETGPYMRSEYACTGLFDRAVRAKAISKVSKLNESKQVKGL
jgi:hypothetical protein